MTEYEQKLKSALDEAEARNAHMARELEETKKSNKLYFELKKDKDAVISGLKEQITTQTAKIAELESELNETKSNYVTACDMRDELNNLWRDAVAARDAWKQVAKWTIKQMRGGNRG